MSEAIELSAAGAAAGPASGGPGSALQRSALRFALERTEAAFAAGSGLAELARLAAATEADPLDVLALCARGVLLDRMGRSEAGADLLEAASAIAPDDPAPPLLLGRVLAGADRVAEAEVALGRAMTLEPGDPQARNDRAVMLMRAHRHAEARALLQDLLETEGRSPMVLCNLASTEVALGRQTEAVRLAAEATLRAPTALLPRRTLCNVLPYRDGVDAAQLNAALRNCARLLPRDAGPPAWTNRPDPARRLRIGLLSGSLCVHPVGWLTVAGFEALDPAGFEIVCFAQGRRAADFLTSRFRAVAREWIDVSGLDDAALAARGRMEGIDILIDLGGWGDGGRMASCAFRLAPVQMKWVGMQNHGTGLPEMDWLVTDRWQTPPGSDDLYDERLLRLADGYVCYSPPPYAPAVAKLPAAERGFVTFGCYNNLAKLTPTVLAAWARILAAMPTARLILKTHQFSDPPTRARLVGALARLGVDPERITLRGASGHRQLLADYGEIDVMLDPFPYAGGLTTCEALWMGVPVVTLPGETFASRHGASHLSNVGLADWIAGDVDEYVALALCQAADIGALAELRAGLRARVGASALCDAPRFGRSLGAGLRAAWRAWCAGQTAHAESSQQGSGQ